jgi:hypothetical protein
VRKIEMDSLHSMVSKQYKMAQVENDIPEILTNVAALTFEYTQISDAFDADVELAKRSFKKKYQECVQTEMSCLEGTGGDISDFTSQVSVLKAENTQTIGLLRGKQSKITKDLRNKLGEFDIEAGRKICVQSGGQPPTSPARRGEWNPGSSCPGEGCRDRVRTKLQSIIEAFDRIGLPNPPPHGQYQSTKSIGEPLLVEQHYQLKREIDNLRELYNLIY